MWPKLSSAPLVELFVGWHDYDCSDLGSLDFGFQLGLLKVFTQKIEISGYSSWTRDLEEAYEKLIAKLLRMEGTIYNEFGQLYQGTHQPQASFLTLIF